MIFLLKKSDYKKFTHVGFLILFLGIVTTLAVTFYVHSKNKKEDSLRLEYEADILIGRIINRFERYEGALIQARAFILNSPNANQENIKDYIRDTEIFSRYPGLQGIGYSKIVTKSELKEHIAQNRRYVPNYNVWPIHDEELLSSVTLLEPLDWRNMRALGYDMYNDPERGPSMRMARDLNDAVMSERVILVQEDKGTKFPGFNIYLPHYRKGADISTVEKRRKELLGFVYSPFRGHELFGAIFSDLNMDLNVEIFEGTEGNPDKNLYQFSSQKTLPDLITSRLIKVQNRNLYLRFSALENFPRTSSNLKTFLVFLIGIIMSVLAFRLYEILHKQTLVAKLMANEKTRLLEKEKEHVAARDDFLSIASHELKTPLTSLKLQAQVMIRGIKKGDASFISEERVLNILQLIDNQTTRLTRLVDDMLDISRIRTGNLKIIPENCRLDEIINEVITKLEQQFKNEIQGLPTLILDKSIQGKWDRFRLEQVLTNLFTNAMRYGKGKPIQVKTYIKDHFAYVEVEDHGIGISKENLSKIFQRFERAGVSSSEVSGLGLGLFISKQIIVAHGGEISVKSEPGKGSTFTITLPV